MVFRANYLFETIHIMCKGLKFIEEVCYVIWRKKRRSLVISNAIRRILFSGPTLPHDCLKYTLYTWGLFLNSLFYKMNFQLISKYVNNATIHWKRSYFILNQQDYEKKKSSHQFFFCLQLFGHVFPHTNSTSLFFIVYSVHTKHLIFIHQKVNIIPRENLYVILWIWIPHNSVHGSKLK